MYELRVFKYVDYERALLFAISFGSMEDLTEWLNGHDAKHILLEGHSIVITSKGR